MIVLLRLLFEPLRLLVAAHFRLSETVIWSLLLILYSLPLLGFNRDARLLFRYIPEILFKLGRGFDNGLLYRALKVVVRCLGVGTVSALSRCLRISKFVVLPLRAVVFGRYDSVGPS